MDLCLEHGLRNVTIEKIAKAAGVSKQTVYKHWEHKGFIVLDGVTQVVLARTRPVPLPGEDSLASVLKFYIELQNSHLGTLLRQVVGEAQTDPKLHQAVLERMSNPARRVAAEYLGDKMPEKYHYDIALGVIWYRYLVLQERTDAALAEQLAQSIQILQKTSV